ncbi:MAG: winged helix-turn-helix transcriptional regulator [Peptococcaceae bacterium]|nr:winged helix-turn-helix transcriptional regulator [Peptococcaceae bacterium]
MIDSEARYGNLRRRKASLFFDCIFYDKWTGSILSSMLHGNRTFNELLEDFYISPSNLSRVLKKLNKYHLIDRCVIDETPVRIEYAITDCGKECVEMVLGAHSDFVIKWIPEEVYLDESYYESLVKNDPLNKRKKP